MALTPSDCRSALKAFLEAIPNIGKVHDSRRRMRNEVDLAAVGKASIGGANVIRVWMISPSPATFMVVERNPGHKGIGVQTEQGNDQVVFQWQIEGYLSVDDASGSEKTATDLAYTIAEAINSYGVIPSLPGAYRQLPAEVEQVKYAMLAGQHLCHYLVINCGFGGRLR